MSYYNEKIFITKTLDQANVIIGLKSHLKNNKNLITELLRKKMKIIYIEKNSAKLINNILKEIILNN